MDSPFNGKGPQLASKSPFDPMIEAIAQRTADLILERMGQEKQSPDLKVVSALYSVEEAAKKLHVTPGWLYQRTRKNTIPYRRLGKYVRFSDADLAVIATMANQ
jgi:excisionase family DNA binding protein